MNLISQAIEWFNDKRTLFCTEYVLIRTATQLRRVKASILEPETETTPQGLKVKTDKYVFLIESFLLEGLSIQRGVQITRLEERGYQYEIIIDKTSLADYNDPNNDVIALATKRKKCS